MSILLAIIVGVPAGILISRKKKIIIPDSWNCGNFANHSQYRIAWAVNSITWYWPKPAIAALFLYGLLPIIRNTYTGIINVDPEIREAARGLGMSYKQLLWKVELPLAMPVILAGIRIATIINVGVATLAAYIAAGGLGEFIFGGISLNNSTMMLAGAIPAASWRFSLTSCFHEFKNYGLKRLAALFPS